MARGTTFLNLRIMLRNELARAASVAVGVDDVPRLNHHLNRAYASRFDKHEWPFLRRTFLPIALSAGQRYYDFPIELDYDRVEKAWVWWSNDPTPIYRGISVDDYSAYDPATDERSDPVLKWDVRSIGNSTQFEVWPLPYSNGQTVTFSGQRKLDKLVDDAHVCLLDDWLIVLDAAAAIEKDSERRKQRAAEAEDRFRVITANAEHGSEPLDLASARSTSFKGVRIAVRSS